MMPDAILSSAFMRPRHAVELQTTVPCGTQRKPCRPERGKARDACRDASSAPDLAHAIAAIAARFPHGILCLSSAAYLHGLLPEHSGRTWLAVLGPVAPGTTSKPIRLLQWTFPGAFTEGVGDSTVAGARIRITCPARTVVDLFRYAHHMGGEECGLVAGRAFLGRGGRWNDLHTVATATGAPAVVGRMIRFLRLYEGEKG